MTKYFVLTLTIGLYSCFGAAELNFGEMLDTVSSFVTHFHLPCSTIIMDSEVFPINETKEFLTKNGSSQIMLNEHFLPNTDGSNCGYFIWIKAVMPGAEVTKLLSKLGASGPGRGPFFWLGALEVEQLYGVSLPYDTQLYVLRRVDGIYRLVEVYDLEEGGRRIWREVGIWSPLTVQLNISITDMWARRGDLAGKTFRVAMLPYGDFLRINDQVLESWHGMVPDIYRALARRINFTYTLALSRDGKWGERDRVCDKMFYFFFVISQISDNREVERFNKRSDRRPCRYDSCPYLSHFCQEPLYRLLPTILQGHIFLLHKVQSPTTTRCFTPLGSSQGSAVAWSTFLQPFKPECWFVLAGAVGACALGLASIAWLGEDNIRAEFSLIKAFTFLLTTYGGVAVRRWSVTPDNISTRLVLHSSCSRIQFRALCYM